MKATKHKVKKKDQSAPIKEAKKVSIKSAGIVDGKFQVVLTDGSLLDGVDEIQTKKVGYGNALYVNIFCRVDGLNSESPSLPISQTFTKKES